MKAYSIEMINILSERTMISFNEINEFKKELKYFCKKYSSLRKDLEIFKLALKANPIIESKNCAILHKENGIAIVKMRLQCRSLKSTLRIIYAFYEFKEIIEFIELYIHNDNKSDFDHLRVKEYLKYVLKEDVKICWE